MTWTDEDLQRVLQRGQVHEVGQQTPRPLLVGWSVRLELPWPPSVNNLYPTHKDGRRYRSKELEAYYEHVNRAMLTEWPQHIDRPFPREWRLAGHLLLRPINYQYDTHNRIKAVFDALQHAGVYANDMQVRDVHLVEGALAEVAHVEVTLERLS